MKYIPVLRLLPALLIAVILLSNCARIPMKVDQLTLQRYERIYREQAKTVDHPLLGLWRVTFAANIMTTSQSNGYYSVGEIIFVAIRRGASIDFISASYLGDFGAMSDQGPTHSINLNGSSFWSFSESPSTDNKYIGKISGLLGSRGRAEATLSNNNGQLIIHEYPEPADGSTEGSVRITTTTMLVGGPLIQHLERGTIATIFLERRMQ